MAAVVAAAVEGLAAEDLDGLPDAALAEEIVRLRRLMDGLEGQWLRRLAAVDARGAAGADQDQPALSTASWLRNRLRVGAGAATSSVRTARALFRGPLAQTGQALTNGEVSVAQCRVVADGTHRLPAHVTAEAEPVLLEAARRLDPPQLRRLVGHLCQVADPDGADRQAEQRHRRRGLWLSSTWDGMVAVDGLLEPSPARPWPRPWSRWPAPPMPRMAAVVASAPPTPSPSWPAGPWRAATCPRPVGSGPSCW
jgi:hypothetical protein